MNIYIVRIYTIDFDGKGKGERSYEKEILLIIYFNCGVMYGIGFDGHCGMG